MMPNDTEHPKTVQVNLDTVLEYHNSPLVF